MKPKCNSGSLKIRRLGFLTALTVSAVLVQFGLCGVASATSSELADAFSRLDALAEELDELLRALGDASEAPSDSAPLLPPEAVPAVPSEDSLVTEEMAREPFPVPVDSGGSPACSSRREIAERTSMMEQRYDANGTVLIAVNGDLPALRAGVLDEEGICAQRLAKRVASALKRLGVIDFETDQQAVDIFVACVDRLREETDAELNKETNSGIRLQRLTNELGHLGDVTHRVTGLERALLRGISKRDRLMQELEQYREEIEAACE